VALGLLTCVGMLVKGVRRVINPDAIVNAKDTGHRGSEGHEGNGLTGETK